MQHFRGNIDNWDPELVDRLAANREVIMFDNTGAQLRANFCTGPVPACRNTGGKDQPH
jgi:hypothetical protein